MFNSLFYQKMFNLRFPNIQKLKHIFEKHNKIFIQKRNKGIDNMSQLMYIWKKYNTNLQNIGGMENQTKRYYCIFHLRMYIPLKLKNYNLFNLCCCLVTH